jgi:hypothetical protein
MAAAKTERLVVTVGITGATMATGLCWTELITQAVTHFDNFEANGFIPWTSGLNCFLGGIVVLCVQAVFSYRLIRVSASCLLAFHPISQHLLSSQLHPGNRLVAGGISFLVAATILLHTP